MKVYFFSFLFFLMMSVSFANTNKLANLNINISRIKNSKGMLMVALYNQKYGFLTKPFKVIKRPVESTSSMIVSFTNIPFGTYAVTLFQDLNANSKLDMMFFFPQEPWGLSNNVNPSFGPPQFDNCSFKFDTDNQNIEIELK